MQPGRASGPEQLPPRYTMSSAGVLQQQYERSPGLFGSDACASIGGPPHHLYPPQQQARLPGLQDAAGDAAYDGSRRPAYFGGIPARQPGPFPTSYDTAHPSPHTPSTPVHGPPGGGWSGRRSSGTSPGPGLSQQGGQTGPWWAGTPTRTTGGSSTGIDTYQASTAQAYGPAGGGSRQQQLQWGAPPAGRYPPRPQDLGHHQFTPDNSWAMPAGGRGSLPGSSPMPMQVYDMKSLSAALATVQAGTGSVARVFQSCSFRPRLPGLTKLVSQLTREGNWQKGLEVYEALGVLGVVPDTTITNAAISACDKGGQWEKAMQIFNNMEGAGLQRDAITYSAVISALSKGRQWSLAIDVFNHMSDANIECDAVTCCSLITALDKGGQWQMAEQVFMQMYADHPQFRMLLHCMDQQDTDTAMPPSGVQGGPPGPHDISMPGRGASPAAWATQPLTPAGAMHESMGATPPGLSGSNNQAFPANMPPHLASLLGDQTTLTTLTNLYRSVSACPRIDEHTAMMGTDAVKTSPDQLGTGRPAAVEVAGGEGGTGDGQAPCPQTPTVKAPGPMRMGRPLEGPLTSDESYTSATSTPPDTGLAAGQPQAAEEMEPAAAATVTPAKADEATGGSEGGVGGAGEREAGSVKVPNELGSEAVAAGAAGLNRLHDPQTAAPDREHLSKVMQQLTGLGVASSAQGGQGQDATTPANLSPPTALQELLLLSQAAGQAGNSNLSTELMNGLMRQLSGMPAAGGGGGGWDMHQEVQQQLMSQLRGTTSNAASLMQMGGAGQPSGMTTPTSTGMMPGAPPGSTPPGLLTPPLARTTSCPPGTRALLRTSSLNIKKAAPNRVCCNALLAAYARAVPTQWQRALRLLQLMWQCGGELEPDIVSYNTCIKAAGNAHQVDLGFKVYELMRSRGIQPTVATYGTLICIAADVGASGLVKQAWSWLRASGLEVHVTAANAYLSALIKEGDWDDAQALFAAMLSPAGPCKPNAVTFSVMSAAYLSRGEPGAIKQLYHQMSCIGVQPSGSTLGQLVCVLASRELWDDALTLLAAMCRQEGSGGRPSQSVFTTVFVSIRDAARRARAALQPSPPTAPSAPTPADNTTDAASQPNKQFNVEGSTAPGGVVNLTGGRATAPTSLMPTSQGAFSRGAAGSEGGVEQSPAGPQMSVSEVQAVLRQLGYKASEARQLLRLLQASAHPDASLYRAMVGAFAAVGEADVCLELFNSMVSSGVPVDADIASGLLGAVCERGSWAKAVQLLSVMQSPRWSPALPAPVVVGVLQAMEAANAWLPAYQVIKAVRSAGGDVWNSLLDVIKGAGAADLLLLALLVDKEACGAWADALCLFTWQQALGANEQGSDNQQGSSFARLPDAYCIITELLYVHGGTEGLRHAVLLVKAAHERGILQYYQQPNLSKSATNSGQGGEVAGGEGGGKGEGEGKQMEGAVGMGNLPAQQLLQSLSAGAQGQALEPGSWVVLRGPSAVQALVVLLAWVCSLAEAAKQHGVALHSPYADIVLLLPPEDRSDLGMSSHSQQQLLDAGGGGASLDQFRRIVSLVLEGTYLQLLCGSTDPAAGAGAGQALTPEQQAVFVIRPPGVQYFPDPSNPALLHVDVHSLYRAILA